jgi:hypothetical protein
MINDEKRKDNYEKEQDPYRCGELIPPNPLKINVIP